MSLYIVSNSFHGYAIDLQRSPIILSLSPTRLPSLVYPSLCKPLLHPSPPSLPTPFSPPLHSTADLLRTEETARRLDTDLAGFSRRLQQLEGAVRARDKEIEKLQRAAEQVCVCICVT